ncbi:hypothetical protein N9937_00120 [bacterium]|nr:hypothetical protein [bacterium]
MNLLIKGCKNVWHFNGVAKYTMDVLNPRHDVPQFMTVVKTQDNPSGDYAIVKIVSHAGYQRFRSVDAGKLLMEIHIYPVWSSGVDDTVVAELHYCHTNWGGQKFAGEFE